MVNPLRKIRWFADWLDDRKATKEVSKLRERFAPQIATAEKDNDWDKRNALESDWAFLSESELHPVYGRKADRLTAKARRFGIFVPPRPALNENYQSEDWVASTVTGDWMLRPEGENKLRRQIREERRARNDEFRKWATLLFAVAGFALAFYSLRIRKEPDPCPRNYYRSDSGQCLFALSPSATQLQPTRPAEQTPPKPQPTLSTRP